MRYVLMLALASTLLGSVGCWHILEVGAEDAAVSKLTPEERRQREADERAYWGTPGSPASLLQTPPVPGVPTTPLTPENTHGGVK